jgi:sigma-B regulation protein RsbU (phosphoserine phosphatase)
MIAAPIPADEAERLEDLRALKVLDTRPEERFDRLVRLAARLFQVPIAYIALIDSDRQWFKAKCGLTVDETGREVSFCGHAILRREPLIVPDATRDDRFRDNPLVTGEPYIRFYAGYPLAGPAGRNVGTFCLADRVPRQLDPEQIELLGQLASVAEHELRMLEVIQTQHELIETRRQLAQAQLRLQRELDQAAGYLRSLLPPKLEGPIRTDWAFISSSQLGGDLFGHYWLDDQRLAIYLFDVCGHGIGASLLSISVHNALRRQTLPETRFDDPADVLRALNAAFPMTDHQGKFFTIWYAVYDAPSRTLRYASGGHPPPILIEPEGAAPVLLDRAGLVVGVSVKAEYQTHEQVIPRGSLLYVYSDGAYEVGRDGGPLLMVEGLAGILTEYVRAEAPRLPQIVAAIRDVQGSSEFADDFSLLEVEFQT